MAIYPSPYPSLYGLPLSDFPPFVLEPDCAPSPRTFTIPEPGPQNLGEGCNPAQPSDFDQKNRCINDPCNIPCSDFPTDARVAASSEPLKIKSCTDQRSLILTNFQEIVDEVFENLDNLNFTVQVQLSGNLFTRIYSIPLSFDLDSLPINEVRRIVVAINRRIVIEAEIVRKIRIDLFRRFSLQFKEVGQLLLNPVHWTQMGDPDKVRVNRNFLILTASTLFKLRKPFDRDDLIAANEAMIERLRVAEGFYLAQT